MKRDRIWVLITCIIAGIFFTSCEKEPITEPIAATMFKDKNLEMRVREVISKPTGVICQSDVDTIKVLNGDGLDIKDITGLEFFKSLTQLSLSDRYDNSVDSMRYNQISDITPLSNLTKLTEHLIARICNPC